MRQTKKQMPNRTMKSSIDSVALIEPAACQHLYYGAGHENFQLPIEMPAV
jgi:hypothetical protein